LHTSRSTLIHAVKLLLLLLLLVSAVVGHTQCHPTPSPCPPPVVPSVVRQPSLHWSLYTPSSPPLILPPRPIAPATALALLSPPDDVLICGEHVLPPPRDPTSSCRSVGRSSRVIRRLLVSGAVLAVTLTRKRRQFAASHRHRLQRLAQKCCVSVE